MDLNAEIRGLTIDSMYRGRFEADGVLQEISLEGKYYY